MPTILSILTVSKTSNISYDRSHVRVRVLGRHSPIKMFDTKNAGTFSSAWICNVRCGRLVFERPGRDSTKEGGAV